MTAGRGFIAIAAASLGGNKPVPTLLVCLLFGVADAFAVNPGTQNMGIPTELVSTIPYIVTVIVLVIYSYKKMVDKRRAAGPDKKGKMKKMEKIVPIIDIPYNKIAEKSNRLRRPARAEKYQNGWIM